MKKRNLNFLFLAPFLFGCLEGEIGPDGLVSLVETIEEPAGVNCGNGGLKIITGIDSDRNGVLEELEIQEINFVCKGEVGLVSLID